ncbi:MAG TPA: F0F1 ATP synthase subunit A [Actinomycetota bacterium]|nr:F0F1 ATP synthase subunit A [Actinomycetota bacterium]
MNLAALFAAAETAETVGKPFHTPEAGHLFNFEPLFCIGGEVDGFSCTAGLPVTYPTIIMFTITALLGLFFWRAFAKPRLVPTGAQNVAEVGIEFVRTQIAQPVLGPLGAAWTPFLTTMFFWVLFMNVMGIIPGVQFPITSRMAYPALLAGIVWLIYNFIGIKNQGFFGYFGGIMFPPGVPKPIYLLLAPIEFISTILVRPLTLAVRLFANMVAGHLILAVLFIGTAVFFASGIGKATFVLPLAFATIMTGFEIFVAAMQAFIITILTAVYIQGAQEAHH